MEEVSPALTLVLALAAGVFAQSLARRIRVPGIVVLLSTGAALGPDGLDWVRPRDLGHGLFAVVDVAVAVILFEGGLNLQISRLRREQAAIRKLITWGALITLGGGMLAVRAILGWDWMTALLFGTLVVVTGPTVIGPLVSELRLKSRVATLLSAEGVLIDPIGAFLAVLALELTLSPGTDGIASGGAGFLFRVGFGTLAGVAGGWLLARVLRIRRLLPEGHENIVVLAGVLLLAQGCELVAWQSGFLAVTVAGVMLGNLRPIDRDLREFKDQLTVLLIGLLFVLLAADVRIERVASLGWPAVWVVGVLVLVVRPLCVAFSTMGSDLTWRERIFVGWIAPRGIVAAAAASLVAAALEGQGTEGGLELRALVFLTIASTVVLAGFTAGPLGTWLGVRLPGRDTVAILGAEGLGFALAQELRSAGQNIVFLDSNPQTCRQAEEAGFAVIFGNAMEERTLRRARFELVGTAVALTPNQTVNSAFVGRARELFRVPNAIVAVERLDTGLASELVRKEQARVAFDGPHDMERWAVRIRRRQVELVHREYVAPESADAKAASAPASGDRYVVLALKRGDRTIPMTMAIAPKPGDVAAVVIYEPEGAAARASLDAFGWRELQDDEGTQLPASGQAEPAEQAETA